MGFLEDFSFYINYISIPEIIFLFISIIISSICISIILFNFFDRIIQIYKYSKMGWFQYEYPNLNDKIIKFKYINYIVDNTTGEIFYINEKMLKKLNKKGLLRWNYDINFYVFNNNDIDDVIKITSPIIKIFPIN